MSEKPQVEALSAEKPGVLERLGAELSVGGVSLIGALAYAQINPNAEEHDAHDVAQIDPRTELAGVLVRLKHGQDPTVATRAVMLLERWVTHQRAFRRWKLKPWQSKILGRFVRTALEEWVSPVCQECHGRELVGLDRGEVVERRVRCIRCAGKGWLHEKPTKAKRAWLEQPGRRRKRGERRYAHEALEVQCGICKARACGRVTRQCPVCGGAGRRTLAKVRQRKTEQCPKCKGTGQRIPGDMERALALGVEVRTYQRHWARRFSWMASGLDRLDRLARNCLQSQLRSGI